MVTEISYQSVAMAVMPPQNQQTQSAEEQRHMFRVVANVSFKQLENAVALMDDNCSENKPLLRSSQVSFDACASN